MNRRTPQLKGGKARSRNSIRTRELGKRYRPKGEREKVEEILQMALLEPLVAILDETDSGLDIDALRIVASGINRLSKPTSATILITHYQRLLNEITPDFVHIMADGKIIQTGDKELAIDLEKSGYDFINKKIKDTELKE